MQEIVGYRHLLDFALRRIGEVVDAHTACATDANGGETVCRAANQARSVSGSPGEENGRDGP
jgi:hypothetical protein